MSRTVRGVFKDGNFKFANDENGKRLEFVEFNGNVLFSFPEDSDLYCEFTEDGDRSVADCYCTVKFEFTDNGLKGYDVPEEDD